MQGDALVIAMPRAQVESATSAGRVFKYTMTNGTFTSQDPHVLHATSARNSAKFGSSVAVNERGEVAVGSALHLPMLFDAEGELDHKCPRLHAFDGGS